MAGHALGVDIARTAPGYGRKRDRVRVAPRRAAGTDDRPIASRRAVDAEPNRRTALLGRELGPVWIGEGDAHQASGIAERDADGAARRVIVRLFGLSGGQAIADRRLYGARGVTRGYRPGALRRQRIRVLGVGLDEPRLGKLAVCVGVHLLVGRECDPGFA